MVTFIQNLTASFTTLWFFLADVSICKHRTWKNFKIHSNFYHSLRIWYHEILPNLIIFRLRLLFLEFKIIQTHVRGHVSCSGCLKFLFIWWVRPQTRLNNMSIIFHLFYYIIWITCGSNLTWFKKLLEMQLIS